MLALALFSLLLSLASIALSTWAYVRASRSLKNAKIARDRTRGAYETLLDKAKSIEGDPQ